MNDINLIPKRLLAWKKNEKQVENIVLEFLNDDIKYGYLTAGEEGTISENDMYPNEAQTRIDEFLHKLHISEDLIRDNDNNVEFVTEDYVIDDTPRKDHLEKVFEQLSSVLQITHISRKIVNNIYI